MDSTKAVKATEDMWATAFARLSPSERLIKAWLQGLGYNRGAPAEVLISLLDTDTAGFLYRDDLPEGVLDAAATHPSRQVWGMAVETGRLSAEQWDRLLAAIADPKHRQVFAEEAAHQLAHRMSGARTGVSGAPHPDARPPSTHTEIATMAAATPDIDPQTMTYTLWWVAALHDNSDAMRQLAYSSNLWIRRSVARATHLPPDVVNLLARDEDRIVHLFLSESCDDAPPHMLLDVWTWWSGSLSFPGRPRNHPNFPREGLIRFADHPEPRMRVLALDDPASPADLVERLSRDPDADVRAEAARDRRLSPESATRLVNDTDPNIRRIAHRHPALPTPRLAALLLDEGTAQSTAQNPAISTATMHHMIDLAKAQRQA